jgi:hypothetical protein
MHDTLLRLTPGEMRRQPRSERQSSPDAASEPADGEEAIAECSRLADEGLEINPARVARAARELLRRDDPKQRLQLRRWLAAIGTGHDYLSGWSHWYGSHDREAVVELAELATEEELWALVDAAVRGIGRGSRWTQGVAGNLHAVTFGWAKARGVAAIRARLKRILAMHDRWTRGGRLDIEFPKLKLPEGETIETWEELSLRVLDVLLGSRSAEVISSALTGLHALIEHVPRCMPQALALAAKDKWRLRWGLNAMESWAALYPQVVEEVRPQLETLMREGPLDVRLQAWVVLAKHANVQRRPRAEFPMSDSAPEASPIRQRSRAIMETEADVRGATSFVDRYGAARGKLRVIEDVTGYPMRDVETAAAPKLMAAIEDSARTTQSWNTPHRGGDMQCSEFVAENAVGAALDQVLTADVWDQDGIVRLAQAFLEGEDAWIVRQTPLPSVDVSIWPTDEEVTGSHEQPPASATIERRLNLLAAEHEVPGDERVLAARVQVFSYREDFSLCLWWEESSGDERHIETVGVPTCPSGRSFVSWLGNWYEPARPIGRRTAAFFTGGSQRLINSFLQIVPARLWRTNLGWEPDPRNPLVWLKNGQPVSRYQRLHGIPRHTNGPYHRQPIMDRWLVKEAAFAEMLAELHEPQRQSVFARHSNSFEK